MSFLDRISKAVSRGVDKAKKEAERMTRVAKIRGEIRELQREIGEQEAQIQAAKVQLGERALEMIKAGSLKAPDLQPIIDQIGEAETQIGAHQEAIAEKEATIEALRAESDEVEEGEVAPEAGNVCPECGSALPEGAAFCAQCGKQISE